MINRSSLLLLCFLSVGAGSPTGMVKRTKEGVPLFLVTDFKVFDRYTDDADSLEEFSGNSRGPGIERTKREIPSPKAILDYLSSVLENPLVFTEDRSKKTKLTNLLETPYPEEDNSDNDQRDIRSVPKSRTVESAQFSNDMLLRALILG